MVWQCRVSLGNGRFTRAEPWNFLNPERQLQLLEPGKRLACRSVTTGNAAGIDLWLEDDDSTEIMIETHLGSGCYKARSLDRDGIRLDFGGLGRQVALYRLPNDLPTRMVFTHTVSHTGNADLPVFVRVTQTDGNQAWSSPIYLIA